MNLRQGLANLLNAVDPPTLTWRRRIQKLAEGDPDGEGSVPLALLARGIVFEDGSVTIPAGQSVVDIAYAATITPAVGTSGANVTANVGALTGNVTVENPTGTPTDGQTLIIRFTQDGTGSRAVSFGTAYAFGTDVTTAMIPSAASAKWEMGFKYHSGDAKWRAVAIARGF